VEQALTAYTRGSAWFSFDEHNRGHLEPGALADVAVLDHDPFAIDPDELPNVKADLTMVGGKIVHATGEFA
jgi:predicted amidohydrolase YtcJ